jgi:hypothetical protein
VRFRNTFAGASQGGQNEEAKEVALAFCLNDVRREIAVNGRASYNPPISRQTGLSRLRMSENVTGPWITLKTLGVVALLSAGCAERPSGPSTCQVKRREFLDEVKVRGRIEPSDRIEIRCEVKSSAPAGTRILSIIPEGTYVEPPPIGSPIRTTPIKTRPTYSLSWTRSDWTPSESSSRLSATLAKQRS